MADKKNKLRVIGRREYVDFPLLDILNIEAKIDTGAFTPALHVDEVEVIHDESGQKLRFVIYSQPGNPLEKKEFVFDEFSQKAIKNSFGEVEDRYIIKTILKVGKKNIWSTISLTNREQMRYQALIGRRPLKGKFIIDVNRLHTGGIKLKGYLD